MHRFTTVAAMQAEARRLKRAGQRLALVPTMGALHDGHLSLVALARRYADHVTASVFVNPTQFGPSEDFARYPRDPDGDARRLEDAGCDALFLPSVDEVYPFGTDDGVAVTVADLDAHLDGPHRPGHFAGVTTVVARLFNACQPDVAVFGQKDAQQLAIVRRMTAALRFPVEIVALPTVREADGLAMSSRNALLSADERAGAPVLHRALQAAESALAGGERRPEALVEAARTVLAGAPDVRVQYVELVEADTLRPAAGPLHAGQRVLVALAAHLGAARLIDNVPLTVPSP